VTTTLGSGAVKDLVLVITVPAKVLGTMDPVKVLGTMDPVKVLGTMDPAKVLGTTDPGNTMDTESNSMLYPDPIYQRNDFLLD